ncbi:EcsC family protein [Niallia sp. NCCP-28]|uniref:EcsC family protein n=1 Tax=Niallia sp. NCCP-28 TaxID=2934712 RepID=UPI00207FD79E|nr:EcsC family protein [Niallia sp. NCCP-28]GKU81566.1 hypothetical protein NCCP28_09620 [Niallia sp. NCCP-28]
MILTKSDYYYLEKIKTWEKELANHQPVNVKIYQKYMELGLSFLPETTKEQIYMLLDSSLFHFHSILFNSTFQKNTADKLIDSARLFNADIVQLEEIKILTSDQLYAIAKQQIAYYRLLAFGQGAASGSGKTSFLLSDLLAVLAINLRSIQVIASIYGRPANSPYEIMTVLKVFHAACLPKMVQKEAWNQLMAELDNYREEFFYKGTEEIMDEHVFSLLLKQSIKIILILHFSKKSPYFSILFGGGANYQFTKKITDFAHNYYQKSYLDLKKAAD